MKRFLIAAVLAAGIIGFSTEVLAAASVAIGLPSFYGRINVGRDSQPQVIYREPKAIGRVSNNQPPVYMRVPRNQSKNWRSNCGRYNACNQRVLFVQDNWYKRKYSSRYKKQHNGRDDNNRGNDNNRGQGRNNR